MLDKIQIWDVQEVRYSTTINYGDGDDLWEASKSERTSKHEYKTGNKKASIKKYEMNITDDKSILSFSQQIF